jgi:FAD/FMN-containing dehydrogenase
MLCRWHVLVRLLRIAAAVARRLKWAVPPQPFFHRCKMVGLYPHPTIMSVMPKLWRCVRQKRVFIPLVSFMTIAAVLARPTWVITRVIINDRDERRPPPAGMVDDSSRLDQTLVAQVWDVPPDEAAAQAGLRELLATAKEKHLRVSIAGARHSMGGQTIYPNGIQINMLTHSAMALDAQHQLLHVQAGATWAQVIAFLDPKKLSVAIMQSNNDFSVGGSLSVNCHGWPFDRPPIDSTVRSLHLMLADGSIRTCSRAENPELFSAVLGGYGLFGIILNADLQVTANERYEARQFVQPTADFLTAWRDHTQPASEVAMALGRLSIARDDFLNESLLYVLRRAPLPSGEVPALTEPTGYAAARAVFLASADSDYGKTLRWEAETHLITHIAGTIFSRNQLLDEASEYLANRTDATTDILQEYFVPPERLSDFLAALRIIVPRNAGNLLNVTIRDVREDHDSMLRYADKNMIALVLLYHEPRTTPDQKMQQLTRESIDAALDFGGCYYLPYRLDATSQQFHRAYPSADQFFELKHKYDPDDLFQNEFYRKYAPN